MAALLAFSQKSGIYDFMHAAWGWPAVESLHFIGLSLLIGTVGLFDLRMMGLAKGIPMSALHRRREMAVRLALGASPPEERSCANC